MFVGTKTSGLPMPVFAAAADARGCVARTEILTGSVNSAMPSSSLRFRRLRTHGLRNLPDTCFSIRQPSGFVCVCGAKTVIFFVPGTVV